MSRFQIWVALIIGVGGKLFVLLRGALFLMGEECLFGSASAGLNLGLGEIRPTCIWLFVVDVFDPVISYI